MKKWTAGTADTAWKVMISARDYHQAERTLGQLIYILTDAGVDTDAGIAKLRAMSGAEIVDGLKAYQASSLKSIENALPREVTQ